MKKSELKIIIKACVKEVLFEEGVLSSLIAEVAFGITKAQNQLLERTQQNEEKQNEKNRIEAEINKKEKLLETKRKMLDAIGGDRMKGIFEGTSPLPDTSSSPHAPMSGIDPGDPGVDISKLFGLAGQKWQHLK